MSDRYDGLARLGWTQWFAERETCLPGQSLARVAAVDRGLFLLVDQAGEFRAKLSGSYRHRLGLEQEAPCVGDWVAVDRRSADESSVVHQLLERRTLLRRRTAGDSAKYQMIAANVDSVMVVQSCHHDFNLKRLERYLVMVREGGADPCILLTKTDLVAPEVLASQRAMLRAAGITAPVLALSNVTREGIDDLEKILLSGKTYCFVGSSGVGKSTIINRLIGRERLRTGHVSATGEGRHTTVRRELIVLETGALVIDNPGMREFGVLAAETGLGSGFADIAALAAECRYGDCGHAAEPGCAVVAALHSGGLGREHYENFLKLREEAAFHGLTRTEKRRKDRDFGKFIKRAKRDLGKR
jgi:ribosome biogenesis GTPase